MRLVPHLGLAFGLGAISAHAAAFSTEDDMTPGRLALDYGAASAAWVQVYAGVLDGKVTTSPPDATTYDRRLESMTDCGVEVGFGKSFGVRINAEADIVKRRQADLQIPRVTTDQTSEAFASSADLTFVTDKGLEIFGGVGGLVSPASSQTVTTGNGTSTTHYHTTTVTATRFGVVRRSGAWEGGFYYVAGAQKERQVDQAAFDGSVTTTQDYIFIPSEAGVIGDFKALEAVWDFDLSFVQERGLGAQDANGHTTMTDYFVARVGSRYPLSSDATLRTVAAYQTLSYARSAFVTLDTIPTESLRILLEFGSKASHAEVGVLGAYGRDGQSLPEFNARYQMMAGALTAGFSLSL